jgi:uncharacterized damage-inducible protein DinB
MREAERIAQELRYSFEGGAWHGPAVLEVLEGIDAKQAAAHPVANAHSIWEIVLHIRVWNDVVLRRTRGETFEPTPDEDWPAVVDGGEEAWQDTIQSLKLANAKAYNAIAGMPDPKLKEPVPGKPAEYHTFYFELHGLVQHNTYHAGQIAVLKKGA